MPAITSSQPHQSHPAPKLMIRPKQQYQQANTDNPASQATKQRSLSHLYLRTALLDTAPACDGARESRVSSDKTTTSWTDVRKLGGAWAGEAGSGCREWTRAVATFSALSQECGERTQW